MIAVAALPAITESGLPIHFSPRTVFEKAAITTSCLEGGFASSLPSSPAVQTLVTHLFLISPSSIVLPFGLAGRAFHEPPVEIGTGQELPKNPCKVAMFFELFIDSFFRKVIKWASDLPLWE